VAKAIQLPPYAFVHRTLAPGLHAYLDLLPRAAESPALARIGSSAHPPELLLRTSRVEIAEEDGYCWVDDDVPCIVVTHEYYRTGSDLDLYLDLLHELTHVRQHLEGADLWDRNFAYVDRWTEVEGYAVAVEEGCRLGMTPEDVVEHLANPWMSEADQHRLRDNVKRFLEERGRRIACPL
jgi:hypothetical protein